jgi:hypothetical protein
MLQISAAIAAVLQQKLKVDPSRFYLKVMPAALHDVCNACAPTVMAITVVVLPACSSVAAQCSNWPEQHSIRCIM